MAEDDKRFRQIEGSKASPLDRTKAHIAATHSYDDFAQTRVASFLATLLQQPDHIATTRRWYEARLAGLVPDSSEARRARLAFLASEGTFYLRFLGLLPITSDEWHDIFADIRNLLDAEL